MKLIPLQETIWVGYGECRGPLGAENDNPSEGEPGFAYESKDPWDSEVVVWEKTITKKQEKEE